MGSSRNFLTTSVKNYKNELLEFLEPSGINQDNVFNIMTHAVLQNSDELLNAHKIGEGMYDVMENGYGEKPTYGIR